MRKVLAVLLGLLAGLSFCSRAGTLSRPNILFIIADQWRAQSFGYAGDPNVKTPNLDRLERESVDFSQAVSRMPVCSPTRASLLTGQRPLTHGVFINDVPLNPNLPTLATVLEKAGYDTGCIGKWHVDGHGRSAFIPRERRMGFEYWKVLECTHNYNHSDYYGDAPGKQQWEGYDAIDQTRDAQRYLQAHAGTRRPFLLWMAWGPPHNPYETAPPRYLALYPPEKIRLPANIPADARDVARRELAGYYAHCTALDDCIGDLITSLKTNALLKNTIIVFTSDHGDMLHAHNQQRKQRPYEESIRVPMLLRLPEVLGVKPGKVAGTINTEDVLPTLLGLCGVPSPNSVEGHDFTGYLRGKADPSGGEASIECISPFGEFTRGQGGREYRGLRTTRYTYVQDLHGPWLLFDNLRDPLQQTNLVGIIAQQALKSKLEKRLKSRLAAEHDAFLTGPEYLAKWNYRVDATGTMSYTP